MVGPSFWVQFINETDFPMKIVSRKVDGFQDLKIVQDVQPHSSYSQRFYRQKVLSADISSCGYIIVFLNGTTSNNVEPPAGDTRIIEFALSRSFPIFGEQQQLINIQDNTNNEFTRGEDTHKTMKSGEEKTLYWFERGAHFMAKAEIVSPFGYTIWRFVVQNFDPFVVQD